MMSDQGFKVFEGVFTHYECDQLLSGFSNSDLGKAGIRNLLSNDHVWRIANDPRPKKICADIAGRPMIPYKATLFEKTGKANWLVAFHQDTALPVEKAPKGIGWGPSSIKDGITFSHAPSWALRKIIALRIHLDASTPDNGPLRVIPGSHHERVLDDAKFERIVNQGPVVECTVGKGGVIVMSPLIVHASSKIKNDTPRRVLHIEYASSLELGGGIRLAQA